jgi:hypothetical protein
LLAQEKAIKEQIAQQDAAAAATAKRTDATTQAVDKVLPKGGGSSGSDGLEKTLREQEAAQKISYDHRAQFEMEYWGEILQTAKTGSAEYTLAWTKTQELQKQLDSSQLADWKKNQSEMTAAARKAASEATAAHRKAAQEEMTDLEMQRMGTAQNTAARIQADAAILASATKLYGALSSEQASALRGMLADEKSYTAQYIKVQEEMNKKILEDNKKNEAAIAKVANDAAKQAAASWKLYLDPIDNAFKGTINGMIQGTQTFRQGLQHLLQSIEASFLESGIKELENYIVKEHAKTASAAAGAAERATIEAGAAVKSKALDAATGKGQITSAAATGAAKAYQAIVGIPFVGPILAPIAAGVAFAGIEAFSGMISSAQGGWERVPFDGAMTELHRDEMVLPKHVADPIRQMAKNGGGQGGGGQVHIHTTDARSWKEQLRRDPHALMDALKYAGRMGHR